MKDQYFVLHKRDLRAEKSELAEGRMVYDGLKLYSSFNPALVFANRNLPSILAKITPLTEDEKAKIKDTDKPYVVAALVPYKYKSYCRDEWEYVPTHEAVRCKEGELEQNVEMLASEASKIFVGVELKVLGGTLK